MHANDDPGLKALFRYFFKLAWIGFGGPLAHISMMQEDTVEKKKWLSREEFTEMLGMTNMLPGPNSTEMCIHIGYVKKGRIGGIVSGLAFTLPGFFIMLALSWIYFQSESIPSISGVFYGINPAVIVIITLTAFRLGKTSVRDFKSFGILIAVFLAVLLVDMNEALLLVLAGVAGVLLYASARPNIASAMLLFIPFSSSVAVISLAALPVGLQVFLEFLKASSLSFGTGLVIIPLIGPEIVEGFKWLNYKQFLDGVTLGQITPGPVFKTATFVGYSVAGVPGAGLATFGAFLPPFILVTLLAPVLRRMRSSTQLQGFLKGVRSGAVGAILAFSVTLGETALVDLWTIAIASLSLIALVKFKASIPLTIVVCGIVGVALTFLNGAA